MSGRWEESGSRRMRFDGLYFAKILGFARLRPMKDNPHTALVLQGGGALGAYEYGAIKALYERRSGFTPTVITGLSIGAVNAAILAGSTDPIKTLDKVWREDFELLFPAPLSPQPLEAIYQALNSRDPTAKPFSLGKPRHVSPPPGILADPALGSLGHNKLL